ncbi:MAG: hypothetical protein NUK57_00895 [Gudongella sp.]|nr:hypothetical protein [Gudongella sp.]
MYDFLEDFGEILGYAIIFFYSLTILNYIVKLANKKFKTQIRRNKTFADNYMKMMRFIVKNHRYFGFLAILFLLLHFSVQFLTHGLSITGIIAAAVMVLQVVLGIYGHKAKKRGKTWLTIHRSIAVLLLIAIAIHIE